MMKKAKTISRASEGAALIEYGILVALIAVLAIFSVAVLGKQVHLAQEAPVEIPVAEAPVAAGSDGQSAGMLSFRD